MALRQELYTNNSTSVIKSQLSQDNKRALKVPVGKIQYNNIRVKRELSEGGASFTLLGSYGREQVVIKEYKVNLKSPYLTTLKMLKEWEILSASFPSQYIVRPVGYCQQPPLILMEYVKNGALDIYMFKQKRLTLEQRISIANDIALGILKLLEIGVIHRDIKTANILITENLRAKICDFDLSRKADSKEPLQIYGTSEYLAPEYSLNRLTDISLPAADVFSFGVVLLELSTRQEVFSKYKEICDDDIYSYINAKRRVEKLNQIICDFSVDWPEGLSSIISDCLNIKSERRPTMREIQERLNQLLVVMKEDKQRSITKPISIFSCTNKTEKNEAVKAEDVTKKTVQAVPTEKSSSCCCSLM